MRFILLLISTIVISNAQPREALLIGNSNYKYITDLDNPLSNLTRLKKVLEDLNFHVEIKIDLNSENLKGAIDNFALRLARNSDTIGFLYYTGHGCQVDYQGYLIPTNVDTQKKRKIRYNALNINEMLEALEEAKNSVNMVFLDACRDVPIGAKGGTKGLGQPTNTPNGSLIVYATKAGKIAQDNSYFVDAIINNINKPNQNIRDIGDNISLNVAKSSSYHQIPVVYSMLLPKMVLNGDIPPSPTPKIHYSFEPQMVHINSGSFIMGSNGGDSDEKPPHKVTIGYDFEIGKYEVTFEEYDYFCNETGRKKPSDSGWGRGKRPVINVSWNDAKAYAKWLSRKTGKNYRLPTEAEWEFVARAGTSSKWSFGDNKNDFKKYANIADSSTSFSWKENWNDGYKNTAPIGSFRPNPWGVYDMHGNVLEWCEDWYLDSYNSTPKDGSANHSQNKNKKVLRGGSWGDVVTYTRSANRYRDNPTLRGDFVGFRLQRTLP